MCLFFFHSVNFINLSIYYSICSVGWGCRLCLLHIFCLDYVLWTLIELMKENSFTLKKARNNRFLADYYGHRRCRWHSTSCKYTYSAEFLLHSLEQATGGIGLHVKVYKAEYMCFNKKGDISTLNGSSLKLEDKFMFLGNYISSTESDINMCQVKPWTDIDRLWFLPSSGCINSTV